MHKIKLLLLLLVSTTTIFAQTTDSLKLRRKKGFQPSEIPAADTTLAGIDSVKAKQAVKVSLDFFRLLTQGENIDSVISLARVPFAWDRKHLITSSDSLRSYCNQVVSKKGKDRKTGHVTARVVAIRHEVIDYVIPVNTYYVMVTMPTERDGKKRDSHVYFSVEIGDKPVITGFVD